VYLRNTSNNWIRILSLPALVAGQFIRENSEDVSIAWRQDGITANVGRFVFYGTKTHTTGDHGDFLRLQTVNNTTVTPDNSTAIGTWYNDLNINQAAGTRRAMIFSISSTVWVMGGVVGAAVPKFFAVKLADSSQGPFAVVNTAGYVSSAALSNFFTIDTTADMRSHWTVTYRDNRMIFGFTGVGSGTSSRIMREVSMSWPDANTFNAASTIDIIPRPLDSAFYGNGGPIGVYGGDNRRTQADLKTYNFLTWYGPIGSTLSTILTREVRFTSEDTFDAPVLVSPYSTEPTNRPAYRVRVENFNLQPNLYGKLHVQVATNNTFTVGLKEIIQPDSELRYFGSQDGLTGGSVQVVIPTPSALYALNQNTWYWRARLVSDKGSPGAWAAAQSFVVSHPPVAQPISPPPASVVANSGTDSYNFSWSMSDTEPTDSQTARRIVVRRRDTLANVVDTGFVASSATNATLTIDADGGGLLEVPLDWTVQLRDADAVTGPTSESVEFAIGSPPTLTVTSPTNVTPVATALPTVTWNFAGFGTRVQKAFRVAFFNNSTPNLLTNQGLEQGFLGSTWTFSHGSALISTIQKHAGAWSAFITPSGSGMSPKLEAAGVNVVDVVSGTSYTATAWVRPTTSNKPIIIGINWSLDGITLLNTNTVTLAAVANTWQQVTITAQAPAGANKAGIFAGLTSTPAVGDTCYVDDLSFSIAVPATAEYLYDSFWRASTATSHGPPTQILSDQGSYGVLVQVQDTAGLVREQQVLFTTDWVDPVSPAGLTAIADTAKVRVSWNNSVQDPDCVGYRLYRRYMKVSNVLLDTEDSASTWYLLMEAGAAQSTYVFDDYTAPLNKALEYAAVQVVDRFGSLIESPLDDFASVIQYGERYYLVPQVTIGNIASFEMSGVTGDAFSRDVEQETLHVVGRGRQVQVGDDLGYSGTLTVRSRGAANARFNREFLEAISSQHNSVYLKTPFGDVFLVALGNVQSTRVPGYGGAVDFVDITVPYTQIIDDDLIKRQV
jgi:hypothetical protein